jgi:serine/threonine protein kinase
LTEQLRDQLQATLSGSYTLERELGGGGMSRVFVAEELRLKRKVVVKVLSPELAQGISARAFDAAGQRDSAMVMYERYLATPFWIKLKVELDPMSRPAVHERLGQLYEARGDGENAAEQYRAFIDLWKNADPELQPRVAEARRRLAKVAPVERPRP